MKLFLTTLSWYFFRRSQMVQCSTCSSQQPKLKTFRVLMAFIFMYLCSLRNIGVFCYNFGKHFKQYLPILHAVEPCKFNFEFVLVIRISLRTMDQLVISYTYFVVLRSSNVSVQITIMFWHNKPKQLKHQHLARLTLMT